jgi:hypothetical protein
VEEATHLIVARKQSERGRGASGAHPSGLTFSPRCPCLKVPPWFHGALGWRQACNAWASGRPLTEP